MNVTLCLTHDCNLACRHRYAGRKSRRTMSWEVARRGVDLALARRLWMEVIAVAPSGNLYPCDRLAGGEVVVPEPPQGFVVSLPALYPSGPGSVPRGLAEAVLMAGAYTLTLWGWAVVSLCLAGEKRKGRLGWRQGAGLLTPGLVSAVAFLVWLAAGSL